MEDLLVLTLLWEHHVSWARGNLVSEAHLYQLVLQPGRMS